MSKLRDKWADEYWTALTSLPANKKKYLSIHDFRTIAAPLLNQIEALNGAYISAVNGRREFRQDLRESRAHIAELEAINKELVEALGWYRKRVVQFGLDNGDGLTRPRPLAGDKLKRTAEHELEIDGGRRAGVVLAKAGEDFRA